MPGALATGLAALALAALVRRDFRTADAAAPPRLRRALVALLGLAGLAAAWGHDAWIASFGLARGADHSVAVDRLEAALGARALLSPTPAALWLDVAQGALLAGLVLGALLGRGPRSRAARLGTAGLAGACLLAGFAVPHLGPAASGLLPTGPPPAPGPLARLAGAAASGAPALGPALALGLARLAPRRSAARWVGLSALATSAAAGLMLGRFGPLGLALGLILALNPLRALLRTA